MYAVAWCKCLHPVPAYEFCRGFCTLVLFIVTCCEVWTLGVWGELACRKRLFNPPPQFSRVGTWCPAFVCMYVYVCVCVCSFYIWIEGLCVVGAGGWLWVLSRLTFYLVCYTYFFHIASVYFYTVFITSAV